MSELIIKNGGKIFLDTPVEEILFEDKKASGVKLDNGSTIENELEGYKNLFVVGGGTHPGSGLSTIYGSAKIISDLIEKK